MLNVTLACGPDIPVLVLHLWDKRCSGKGVQRPGAKAEGNINVSFRGILSKWVKIELTESRELDVLANRSRDLTKFLSCEVTICTPH